MEISKKELKIKLAAAEYFGIWKYAWWKEGVQYVGTSGKTLGEVRDGLLKSYDLGETELGYEVASMINTFQQGGGS